MAKIVRYNGNLVPFASSSLGTERTLFGEVTQANDITSQFTSDFLRGWGIVGPSDQPTLQDFNAVSYTHGQILAYLHQVGVPEYNAAQEYHLGSFTNYLGALYVSLANTNVGNTPASSPLSWSGLSSGKLLAVQKFTASGTYTPTAGMKTCIIHCQGAGGAGGGPVITGPGGFSVSGGGCSGGYGVGKFTDADIGASKAVTIGTGGIGVVGGPGGAGGLSTVTGLISAPGGLGGTATSQITNGTAAIGPGGDNTGTISTGGNIFNATGIVGGHGWDASGARGGAGAGSPIFGGGGGAPLNLPGSGGAVSGVAPGSGGSGLYNGINTVARAGGNGANGVVIIWEYS